MCGFGSIARFSAAFKNVMEETSAAYARRLAEHSGR
jgi:transcriptional regulator GlxA family with amidase domain